jgi:alkylation response protein AidB-like acyl-CoA dehydrogenase
MTDIAVKQQRGGAFLIEAVEPQDIFIPEDLSEELLSVSKLVEDFVTNEIEPNVSRLEKLEPGLNEELLRKMAETGIVGMEISEEFGGADLPKTATMLVSEKLSAAGGFATTFGAHQSIGSLPIVYFGNQAQKEKYLPKVVTAELIGAYALTEPNAGSDAQGGKVKAVLSEDGTHYVLDGTKMWITNGGFADYFIVFAKIDGEKEKFSAFIVERSWDGVSTGAEEHKMGIKSSSTRMIMFDKVKVPVENLLGEIGQGAKIAFNILNTGRFKLGAGALGGAKHSLHLATKYAKERKQFDTYISQFGMMKEKLAEMALRSYAVESIIYRTAGLIDAAIGEEKDSNKRLKAIEEYAIECSIIKVMGSELLDFAVDEGVQIHGGYGYSQEYAIERAYRDSRINRIYEGTNEINRMLTTSMLLKRGMKGDIPLMKAAQEVGKEVLDPIFDFDEPEGTLAEERMVVQGLKKATLMVAGAAAMKFGPKLEAEQEIVARCADMAFLVYACESAFLRTLKLEAQGQDITLHDKMVQVYVHEAAEKAVQIGREALCRFVEGDELPVYISALKRFTKHPMRNTIALRRDIADAVIEADGYPFKN